MVVRFRSDWLNRIRRLLDGLIVGGLLLAILLWATGGFEFTVLGLPISAHRPGRAAQALLLLLGLRLLFFDFRGRAGLLFAPRRVRGGWQRLERLRDRIGSDAPDRPVPLLGRHTIWAAAGICAFAVVFLSPQLRAMYSVPDLGDPLLSMWRMGWFYHWLQGDPRPLFSPNIFYPEPLTLTYSDSMLLPGLVGAPLLAAGVHPVVAYNVVFIAGFVLSAFAMYLLAVKLTGSPPAAFVSALLFGFYPFRFEHYSHLELQWTMWMPLALLAIHQFIETRRTRFALAAAILVVAQLYSSMYFAVFFCLYLVPVAGLLLFARRTPARTLWRGAALAAGVASVLAIPLARPYLQAQDRKGDRGIEAVTVYSATFKDYVSPNTRSLAYDGVLPHPDPERGLFPGFVSIGLTAIALAPPLGAVRLAYAGGMLLAFELSRGFHGELYPWLYRWFMPIRGMRVPARFSMIVGLSLSLLAGYGSSRLIRRIEPGFFRFAAVAVLLVAVTFDLRSKLDLVPAWRQPPAVYASVAGRTDVVLAEFPWWSDRPEIAEQLPLMYFSLWHWANMVNGASGFEPPQYQQFLEAIHRFPDEQSIRALRARGVTHVTINCALYGPERDCHAVLDFLDASPEFQRVAIARWQGDSVALYELRR